MKNKQPLSPYEKAQKRVKKKKEFYVSLFSWLLVSAFLFGINALTSREHWWAFYPFLGWGLGIAFQAFEVFGVPGMSDDWEEQQIQEEMERMRSQEETKKYLEERGSDDELQLPDLQPEKKYRDEDLV